VGETRSKGYCGELKFPFILQNLHRYFLYAALVILVLNDHVLKAAVPGIITGKLSDVAGVVLLPLVLVAGWELLGAALGRGSGPRARVLVEHGIAAYRAGNVLLNLPHAVAASAWALAQVGEVEEALRRFEEGAELLEREAARGIVGIHAEACCSLGRAALLLGRLDDARRLGENALTYAPSHPGFAAHALRLLGDVAAHPERLDAEEGVRHYQKAFGLAETHAMRPLIAHCHLGLSRLDRRTKRVERAREHARLAAEMYRAMEMTYWWEQALEETKQLGSTAEGSAT